MNVIFKGIASTVFCLGLSTSFALGGFISAAPKALITRNTTEVESNAYVNVQGDTGLNPSVYPTHKNSVGSVAWYVVRGACNLYKVGNACKAEIRMATDTDHPISLGVVTLDLETGDITPKQLSKDGYTLTVNGLADCTLSKQ